MAEISYDAFISSIRSMDNAAILTKKQKDGSYEIKFISDAYCRLLGLDMDEVYKLVGGPDFILAIHPDDRLSVKRMLRRKISGDGMNTLQFRIMPEPERMIWVEAHFSFIQNNDGSYIYTNYQDITAAKEYEARLRTAYINLGDNFYRSTAKTLGMFRVNLDRDRFEDMQGRDLYGTDSRMRPYSEVLRLRKANYPLKTDQNVLEEIFNPQALREAYLSGRMEISEEFFSMRKNRQLCYVSFTAVMTRHPFTGEVVAFITEEEANRKQVENTLLKKILARQFDMVAYMSNGRYGVVVGDESLIEKGSIFPLQKKGEYEEYLETQVYPVLYGEFETVEEMMDSLSWKTVSKEVHSHDPYIVNISIKIGDEVFYKRLDYYLIDPEAEFYIVLKSDTTDVQKLQIEQNNRLKEALEAAEAASVAKTAFLSQMSHEIRTPMNAIIGIDNIALKDPDITPQMKEYLEKIGMSGRHLLSLINDILDMSRIESGRMSLRKEEFAFSDFLDQINTIVDSQCQDKGLHFDCAIHGAIAERYIGDNTKLKQVMINILGNSVKFTDPGGTVSLSVECKSRFEDQSTLEFRISDTGIGMDKEYLPKIFEAFSQENDTTTNAYGGSGLGLAITKNIVEMMDGHIEVESEKGVGTTFIVTVTLKNVKHEISTNDIEIDPKELDVLIVDDDEVACKHASIVLEEIGIASEYALGAKEGLELINLRHARHKPYNLILVDLKMPEIDGVELTKKIREIEGEENAAILIITAYNWEYIENEAREAGVDSFLTKPLFASNVIEELKLILANKTSGTDEVEIEPADLTNRHILFAEDMEINAQILEQILKMKQIESTHAENGQVVFDIFRESEPGTYDAILMDVRMPVMDGLQATEAIRACDHPDAKTIPIIAMTANAFDEDVKRSLQAGMNAHLAKPVEPEHLYQTLGEYIARNEAGTLIFSGGGEEVITGGK